ncbi:MAG: poly-gamma-glutamate system protein [Calditrichaeota bacterium]|nr:poly-gamma-glutamate system protein [Calditrichota bacterium]
MYRPTIKSNFWLGALTVAFLLLYWWAESNFITVRSSNFEVKLTAARTMLKAMEALQSYRLPHLSRTAAREIADPLVFTLLGEKDSPITTDEGRIDDKITALNPNFAAAMVDMIASTGVERGDTVAVLLTGSIPGANIATYAACQALGIVPVAITSVGSSWWGANSADFTWLDMERILSEKGVFPFRSIAASLGGADDQGGLRLSDAGKEMILEAIQRNEMTLIREGSLASNVSARIALFERIMPLNRYQAVVNIGGGIAAIGHRENGKLIPSGVHRYLPARNYPSRGVIHSFSDQSVPVAHVYDVVAVAQSYHLPVSALPLPHIGTGDLFSSERYNLTIAAIAAVTMLALLAVVKYLDRLHYKWREDGVDPDTLV